MENQLIKMQDKEELQSIDDMIKDCDSAVVTYGIDKDYNIHKVVTLFSKENGHGYQFEEYHAAHNKTLAMFPKMALAKTICYKVKDKKVKRMAIDFCKVLFRSLFGFVKDSDTHDIRHKYEYKPD